MRWKSLLTCPSASMCSTSQLPSARNAFSSACAARTWPAPEEAERIRTRGFRFRRKEVLIKRRRQAVFRCPSASLPRMPPAIFCNSPKRVRYSGLGGLAWKVGEERQSGISDFPPLVEQPTAQKSGICKPPARDTFQNPGLQYEDCRKDAQSSIRQPG